MIIKDETGGGITFFVKMQYESGRKKGVQNKTKSPFAELISYHKGELQGITQHMMQNKKTGW